MANMGYCRFENTVADMEDCIDHIEDTDIEGCEKSKRADFIELCITVAVEYSHILEK